VLELWVRVGIRIRVRVRVRDTKGTKRLGTRKSKYEMSGSLMQHSMFE